MSARIVEVIEVETRRGNGATTPIRRVMQYFDRDGNLLAERDHALGDALEAAADKDAFRLDELFMLAKERKP